MADDELRIHALATAAVPVRSYSHNQRSISIGNYGKLRHCRGRLVWKESILALVFYGHRIIPQMPWPSP